MESAREPEQHPTWERLRERLGPLLGPDMVGRWFDMIVARVERGGNGVACLRLRAPNKFHGDWIKNTHGVMIEALWRAQAPGGEVVFEVQDAPLPAPSSALPVPAKVIQLDFWEDGVPGVIAGKFTVTFTERCRVPPS